MFPSFAIFILVEEEDMTFAIGHSHVFLIARMIFEH